MIIVNELGKRYGEQILFEEINFSINPGERLGIVGRNGHGKSTLFKMIAGLEGLDEGSIKIPQHYKLGYLDQHIHFEKNTVIEEGCSALPEGEDEGRWRVEKVLSGLGYKESDFDRHPDEFSGGYQMRLNLAKVLVSEPNLLMLDEPTNFLDIVSIRWLTLFLKKWDGELMLISHDRTFMDGVVNQVMGIHRGAVTKIRGDTEAYYSKILETEELHEKSRVNLEKKKKQAQLYIDRFRATASKATQIQSRIKAVQKMGSIDKLGKVKDLYFKFNEAPIPPKTCLTVDSLSFGYDKDNLLIEDFRLTVSNDDRIAVIGKNGQGKTTLLNLMAKQLQPLSGKISHQSQTRMAHFVQANVADLRNNMTVLDEILDARDDGDMGIARRICGSMMFSKLSALKTISVLSGGEKSRVILGRLLGKSANLLLLDEPTHHLDMQSAQAMIQSVKNFSGATVIVTHDEHFLRSVANRLVVFQSGKVLIYEGGYDDFLIDVGWEEDGRRPNLKNADIKSKAKKVKVISDEQVKIKEVEEDKKRNVALLPYQKKLDEAQAKASKAEDSLAKKELKLAKLVKAKKHYEIKDLENEINMTKKGIDKISKAVTLAEQDLERVKGKF
jgi:ATP-binding cassette subfamily F protein 3